MFDRMFFINFGSIYLFTVRPYIDYVVPYELFNHVDFLLGNDVGQVQNAKILEWLQEIYKEP